MQTVSKSVAGAALLLSVVSFGANGQAPLAESPSDMLAECLSQLKSGNSEHRLELRQCLQKCRIRSDAHESLVAACHESYSAYRKASGQAVAGSAAPEVKSYQLKSLTATFSPRNGRLNRFSLVGEHPELAKRAARVCAFKLPDSQSHNGPQFQAQFGDEIRAIKNQGANFAYKLSDVTWTEDGTATHYTCQIGQVGVVAVP